MIFFWILTTGSWLLATNFVRGGKKGQKGARRGRNPFPLPFVTIPLEHDYLVRKLLIIIPLSLVTGCAVQISKYYTPVSETGVNIYQGRGCTAPGASYSFDVANNIEGFISAGIGEDSWGIYYGFSLGEGAKLRVLEQKFIFYSDEWDEPVTGRLNSFKLSVYGGLPNRKKGYIKKYGPMEELAYTGLNERGDVKYLVSDNFRSSIQISKPYPESFKVHFPKIRANGKEVQLPDIEFKYTEKEYFLTCVQ